MENNKYEGKPIAFAYYYNGEFMGWRADTFNTISKEYVKVYHFSREQADTVLGNVKGGCNRAWQSLISALDQKSNIMTQDGISINKSAIMEHVSKTDETFRNWGEFEIHIIPFPEAEEWYELQGEGEEWKRNQFIENLEPAIEVHKFKICENEN